MRKLIILTTSCVFSSLSYAQESPSNPDLPQNSSSQSSSQKSTLPQSQVLASPPPASAVTEPDNSDRQGPTEGAVTATTENQESDKWYREVKVVPFGFFSDTIGNSLGAGGIVKGAGQDQASLVGAAFVSDKGSYMAYLGGFNYKIADSWLLDANGYAAEYKDNDYSLGVNANNDSDEDDRIETDGEESRLRVKFKYILPWAEGEKHQAEAGYRHKRTRTGHNPLKSGVSSFAIEPFYRTRDLDRNLLDEPTSTWGVALKFDWDNRDDTQNPNEGSHTEFTYTYAPDAGNDEQWSTWEFQNSQYWSLGKWEGVFERQVLAFDFYTADTPSWNDGSDDNKHRPPEYAGVRLGGLFRLRSFSSGRFVGRSAVNYSVEYRVMPEWQPLGDWPIFNLYDVPWWQWTAFADIGRVADDYDVSELHEDMQWSAGGGIRFQVEGVVVRTEMAWGPEDSLFRVMINQTF